MVHLVYLWWRYYERSARWRNSTVRLYRLRILKKTSKTLAHELGFYTGM